MSDKPDVATSSTVRANVIITQCAVVTPLILTWIKVTTELPQALFGLGLSAWILGVLILITLRCNSELRKRIDDQGELIEELHRNVKELARLLRRDARAVAINSALDDNVTSINERR
jgi:hypothetical protein